MTHDTRSRRKRLQPASPPPQQQTRKRPFSRDQTLAQESKRQRGKKDLEAGLRNYSPVHSLSESSSEDSSSESDASSTSSPPRLSRRLPLSKRKRHNENSSVNIVSSSPARKSDGSIQPAHVQITHFDFTKYQAERPSTPLAGSESNPFKIEDSPDTSSSLPIHSQAPTAHRQPRAQFASHTEWPIMQHNIQARNLNPVEVEHLNSNSFMISPISLGPSKAVTTIVNSPDASIIFLKCFLAAEKHWLRSLDQDTDIDKVFWGRIAKSFNRKGLGYRINEAETARAVACILRSTSYITSMKQQHPRQDDVLQRLFSAIDDCRLMSLRRRQQQRLGLEHAQSLIDNQVTEEVVEKGILTKIPQNLKEYHNFMSALRMNEVNKGGTAAVAPIAIAEPRLADRETRNKGFLNPHIFTTNPNTQTTKRNITRPNIPRNCLTGPRRMMQVTNKRIGQRGSHRAQDRSSYSSARRSKSHFRGTTSLEKYQQQKIHRLERQLKEEQCRKRLF